MKKSVTIDYELDWGSRIKSSYAIEHVTDRILEIFDNKNAKATFFVSTEILPKNDKYVKKIFENKHEIASHGYEHNLKYDLLSRDELNIQISKSKSILEDLIGEKVVGFRTPMFRKNEHTDEILKEFEFEYDSSSVSTSLKSRYAALQNSNELLIKQITVSNIYGKFPAGIKWINLFGKSFKNDDFLVIYSHPFDFLSIKETIKLYDKNKIPLGVLLFYLARKKSMFKTLLELVDGSKSIRELL